jgi:predicted enzyme related to lactoylglutathione lyase
MGKKVVHVEFPAKDADRAQKFWETVGGWSIGDSGMPGIDYRMFQEDGWGGAVFPEMEGASGTTIYFGSDDIEADLAKVRELGGKDSEGNSFSLFQGDESVTMPEGAPGA